MSNLLASSPAPLSPHTYQRLPPLFLSQAWAPAATTAPAHPPLPAPIKLPILTVATLNIWFDGTDSEARYPAIIDLLVGLRADVVCLQEVHEGFLRVLRAHAGARGRFGYFGGGDGGADIASTAWYGCLILYDKATVSPSSIRCDLSPTSVQKRHLLSACFTGIRKQPTEGIVVFTVGTSHVESPVPGNRNPEERRRQLRAAKVLLSEGGRGAIFCGDTNVSPEDEADFPPEMDWSKERDLWLQAGRTADTMTFGMTYAVKEPPKRLDRVFMVDDSISYEVVKADLFATERIHPDGARYAGRKAYLSDHIGVYTAVRLKGQ